MSKIVEKYNKRPVMGDIYTLPNLKILLDDLLNEYLAEKGHRRSYLFMDIRNGVGIVSTAVAAAVIFMSLNYKFENIKAPMGLCLLVYFVINAASLAVTWYEGERFCYDAFSVTTRSDDTPSYTVLVYMHGKCVPMRYTRSFFDLFDRTGRMDHAMFVEDLDRLLNKDE